MSPWMAAGRDRGDPAGVGSAGPLVRPNQRIEVAGGVTLVADLYVPHGSGPFPAVVEITPYGAQCLASLGHLYAARGFLFLAVDGRGRHRSSGDFDPLAHDQGDGHAMLRWLEEQPLCDGRIGTRGHSYAGSSQLLCAIDAPASLRAMVVAVAPADPFENVPFQGGAYDLDDLSWLMGMTGRGENDEEEPREDWPTAEPDRAGALRARPFCEVDERLGGRQEILRRWVAHWRLDEFWKARAVGPRLHRTNVPTLFLSGWWDGNGRGAPVFFGGMRDRARTAEARDAQRLVIGPWNHDLEAPDTGDLPEADRLAVERAATRDALVDELAWFDRHLKGLPAGPSTAARVSLFVTGIGRWRDFEDWPPRGVQDGSLFLQPGPGACSGALVGTVPSGACEPSRYVFDPEDPTPFAPCGGAERGPFDAASISRGRTDVLAFDTPHREGDIWLVGDVWAVVYASSDAPDFDVYLRLLDVHPDGRAIFLTDGVLRLRFRDGFERPAPLPPGEIAACHIDLWHLGHVLRSGHALRLEIASAAFPRFDVNPCTGGDLATETECRPARVSIHHDDTHPSRLILPWWSGP